MVERKMLAQKLSRLKVFGATFFQKGSEKHLTQTNYQACGVGAEPHKTPNTN